MDEIKKEKMIEYICKKCGHKEEHTDDFFDGYYNWKCSNCFTINPILNIPVIWHCKKGGE